MAWTPLPAGIADRNIEAYNRSNRVEVLRDGKIENIFLSDEAMHTFEEVLQNDPAAETAIMRLGIDDRKTQIAVLVRCRFGGFDKHADINENGISVPDYWDCPWRGTCRNEGVICKLPGGLTQSEMRVTKLVARDKANCEIAAILNISINTVATHITRIERKIRAASKCGIVRFAMENNIL